MVRRLAFPAFTAAAMALSLLGPTAALRAQSPNFPLLAPFSTSEDTRGDVLPAIAPPVAWPPAELAAEDSLEPVGFFPKPSFGRCPGPCAWPPPSPCPVPCPAPALPVAPEKKPAEPRPEPRPEEPRPEQPPQTPELPPEQAAAGGSEATALATINVVGDQLSRPTTIRVVVPRVLIINGIPTPVFVRVPANQVPGLVPAAEAIAKVPAVTHSFKIAENECPRPQCRVFATFNYYNNIFGSTNDRLGADIGRIDAYRGMFGFEYALLGGNASIGMRLPLNTLSVGDGFTPGTGGTSTALGDLAIILKYAVINERDLCLSGGILIQAPTGPASFAGYNTPILPVHSTILSPYIGYILGWGRFYMQGFSSVAVPTDDREVTLLFNDFQFGWYALVDRSPSRIITAIVPIFEVHVNTPLNHRGILDDLNGLPDWVNLSYGLNVEVCRKSLLTFGVVNPVTGPRPFDIEAFAYFNFRF
ncbi:MAG: hypothetical protein NZ700_11460 [Gemmataceae bacterium]|nr:hypothetical protein [Gemmataceae bacterium]MDW8265149.1 hypothetical protein [Gemmataceae bacterium]